MKPKPPSIMAHVDGSGTPRPLIMTKPFPEFASAVVVTSVKPIVSDPPPPAPPKATICGRSPGATEMHAAWEDGSTHMTPSPAPPPPPLKPPPPPPPL